MIRVPMTQEDFEIVYKAIVDIKRPMRGIILNGMLDHVERDVKQMRRWQVDAMARRERFTAADSLRYDMRFELWGYEAAGDMLNPSGRAWWKQRDWWNLSIGE